MFDLSKPLHLLYAWGNTISGSTGYPGYHGIDGAAKYTGEKITMAPTVLVRIKFIHSSLLFFFSISTSAIPCIYYTYGIDDSTKYTNE